MDVAVPEDTGQDTALEVEQCTCPTGYRGPSCQVSPGSHTPVQPAPFMVLPLALSTSPSPPRLPTQGALPRMGPAEDAPPMAIFPPPGL